VDCYGLSLHRDVPVLIAGRSVSTVVDAGS
jgi:hypothetical protein